jgi:hypothetical protein
MNPGTSAHRRGRLRPWLGAAVIALALGAACPAQAADSAAIHAVALRADERLRLDGTLAHPAWQRAPVFRDFVEKAPNTGAVPRHETRVRVLFDDQALYVGIEALDPEPALIRAPLVRHDGVNRTQDFVVVYLDAIGSRQSAQFFRVNAAGSTGDGMHSAADDSEDFAPDFDFDAATARTDSGYTAVLRIPFASLRFASGTVADGQGEASAQPWRIMVARRVPREQVYLHSSVLIPRDAPSFIAALQPLDGVTLPDKHQFLTLRPSLTWRRQHQQPAGAPSSASQQTSASLDLKWRPLPELVVDATLNPDFSQVALDVPQLAGNTRFALEFPETRPFFFESSDLLRSPTAALYSRSFTEPRWGLRSTWRGARLAGSAFAIDDRGGGSVLLPGTYGSGAAEQPASRALVARVRGDAGALQWGAVAAARRYADDRGENQVLGPDLGWQIDEAWRLRAQWLQSDTTAQPQGGGLARGAATSGHMAYARLWYQTPQVEGDVTASDTGPGFRNDSGFVVQNGVRRLAGRIARGWQPLGQFNDFWVNLEGERVQDRGNGQTVSQDLSPGIWLTGAHNLEAWSYWHGASALRTAADGPLLHERYLKSGLTVTPALWLPLLTGELQWGRLADVSVRLVRPGGRASLTLTTRPLARLEFEPSLVYAWLRQDGTRVYGEAAHQVLARWHFTARQSLRAIVQYTALDRQAEAAQGGLPALAAQHSAGTTGSLTYAWRESMGTVLYVGATRSRSSVGLGAPPASVGNEVFIKLQVDADEVLRLF